MRCFRQAGNLPDSLQVAHCSYVIFRGKRQAAYVEEEAQASTCVRLLQEQEK